jgi:hypothetical protein
MITTLATKLAKKCKTHRRVSPGLAVITIPLRHAAGWVSQPDTLARDGLPSLTRRVAVDSFQIAIPLVNPK